LITTLVIFEKFTGSHFNLSSVHYNIKEAVAAKTLFFISTFVIVFGVNCVYTSRCVELFVG